jgi:hypothetical protein
MYFSKNELVKELLGENNIDRKDVFVVSNILTIGFLKLLQGYYNTIEYTLLGK